MEHCMSLRCEPFSAIKCGRKTIELRLFDEKRALIAPGDTILFTCTENHAQTLRAEVTALHRFACFAELYRDLPLLACGYTEETVGGADPADMDAFYSREEQARYGVVGIELRVIM